MTNIYLFIHDHLVAECFKKSREDNSWFLSSGTLEFKSRKEFLYILILKNTPKPRGNSEHATHTNHCFFLQRTQSPKDIDRSRGKWVTVLIKQTRNGV